MAPSWKESHGHLPVTIDPIQLAERGARLTGTLPLKSMPRLAQGSLEGSGDVSVDLAFEREEGQQVFVMHGTLRVPLRVTCQRCLETMELNLEAAPWLFLTKPGARLEPQEGDADILVADKPLSLSGLVEDELLLALPMVPMHAPDQCTAKVRAANAVRAAPDRTERGRKNPFAVLGRLKKTK
ncbi:MAG: YceD family protein [Sulfuricaulis sp.]